MPISPPASARRARSATAGLLILGALAMAVAALARPSLAETASDPKGPTMTDAAVQTVIDANTAAVAARDIGAILRTYEPGAVMVTGPGTTAAGTDALRAGFVQFLAVDPQIAVPRHDIVVADGIALHLYPWTMTGRAPDGTAIAQSGLSVIVLRRQADGSWKIAIDHPFGDRLLRLE